MHIISSPHARSTRSILLETLQSRAICPSHVVLQQLHHGDCRALKTSQLIVSLEQREIIRVTWTFEIYLPQSRPRFQQQILNSNESDRINRLRAKATYTVHPIHTYRYISDGAFLYVQPTRPTDEADQQKGNNLWIHDPFQSPERSQAKGWMPRDNATRRSSEKKGKDKEKNEIKDQGTRRLKRETAWSVRTHRGSIPEFEEY